MRGRRAAPLRQALLILLVATLNAQTAYADDAIDPSLIPDGSYPAHVERVINARRIEVTMQGTLKVFLSSGRRNVVFTDKLKPNDDIVVTLSDGKVSAFTKKTE